ncbi:MAG: hypothetical protein ACJ74Z_15225, partial [Bryobacteraceae bacterium]
MDPPQRVALVVRRAPERESKASFDDGPVKQGGVWQARNASDGPISVDEEGREIPMVNGRPVPE